MASRRSSAAMPNWRAGRGRAQVTASRAPEEPRPLSRPQSPRFRSDPDVDQKLRDLRRMRALRDLAARRDDAGLHRDVVRRLLVARLGLCQGFRRGGDGRRLRGLVRRGGAVSPSVRPADPAYRHRSAQQGADRRRARPFHLQQLPEPFGAGQEARQDRRGAIRRRLVEPSGQRAPASPTRRAVSCRRGSSALPRDRFVDWLANASLRGLEALPAAPLASKGLGAAVGARRNAGSARSRHRDGRSLAASQQGVYSRQGLAEFVALHPQMGGCAAGRQDHGRHPVFAARNAQAEPSLAPGSQTGRRDPDLRSRQRSANA